MSIFQKTVRKPIGFSTFPLGRTTLVGANFGELVPVFVQEVLPNDKFKVVGNANIEFAPMIAPMMHNVKASFHYFYVPNRILYQSFETAFTGSRDGRSLPEDEIPLMPGFEPRNVLSNIDPDIGIVADRMLASSLFDYLEYPVSDDDTTSSNLSDSGLWMSDLPLRAYFKIWYDWYRDENLQYRNWDNEIYLDYYGAWESWFQSSITDMDAVTYCLPNFNVRHRSYKKDYFTAALPSPQKGEPVVLSLGSSAPIKPVGSGNASIDGSIINPYTTLSNITEENGLNIYIDQVAGSSDNFAFNYLNTPENTERGILPLISGTFSLDKESLGNSLYVDLSQASSATINELRTAFAVQRILEAINLGGSRYNEFLLGQYGTAPTDLRLNRPQFLGGWHTQVAVQKVLQNGMPYEEGSQFNQVGYAAGRSFAAGTSHIFNQEFKEPGYIIGLMSIMPQAGYSQGLPRHLSRKTRWDYYNPNLAYLGEQAILNKELYISGDDDVDNATFGFMQRFAEYRTSYNTIHGDFRGSLNYYHMYRKFTDTPVLSEDFILTNSVDARPFAFWQANSNVNQLIWAEINHGVMASRPMPYNPMPELRG